MKRKKRERERKQQRVCTRPRQRFSRTSDAQVPENPSPILLCRGRPVGKQPEGHPAHGRPRNRLTVASQMRGKQVGQVRTRQENKKRKELRRRCCCCCCHFCRYRRRRRWSPLLKERRPTLMGPHGTPQTVFGETQTERDAAAVGLNRWRRNRSHRATKTQQFSSGNTI